MGERTAAAVRDVFGDEVELGTITAIDLGRGVFSHVTRVELSGDPSSVAVKLLRSDPNGAVALTSGAVDREILAYQTVLPATPGVCAPELFGVSIDERMTPSLVMTDLSSMRHVDQVNGLGDTDLRAIVIELAALHNTWASNADLDRLDVRRSTPASLPADAIERGASILDTRWSDITAERRHALHELVAKREAAVAAFTNEGGATLCHGDPRADNVAFDHDGRAILFDWQQLAIQFGEADISWLLATSVDGDRRRSLEGDILASYAMTRRQDAATTWRRYVIGMTLPGLAVMLLAQRVVDDERTERLVRTSIERIADAVTDLRVATLVSS